MRPFIKNVVTVGSSIFVALLGASSLHAQTLEEQSLRDLKSLGHQYMTGTIDASAFKSRTDAILSSEPELSGKADLAYAVVRIFSRNVPSHLDDMLLYSEAALLGPLTPVQKVQVLSYRGSAFEIEATFIIEYESYRIRRWFGMTNRFRGDAAVNVQQAT